MPISPMIKHASHFNLSNTGSMLPDDVTTTRFPATTDQINAGDPTAQRPNCALPTKRPPEFSPVHNLPTDQETHLAPNPSPHSSHSAKQRHPDLEIRLQINNE